MDLAEVRRRLDELEERLDAQPVAPFFQFRTPYGELLVSVTNRLRSKCRKGRTWKSAAMLTALKNAAYGFDPSASRSRGGADGIFSMDRSFTPPNAMMTKLFARFIDKPDPLVPMLAAQFQSQPEEWFAVRVVSHHMRLLGVLSARGGTAHLVLVDFDDDKGK